MSLFDQLQKANFRGVDFPIENDNSSIGRRVKTHAIQNRDYPYHEDMGADTQPFSVEAVIGGADFVKKADEFEKLLMLPGTGKLVLPHQGELTVVVIKARRSHNYKKVGIVKFSITFERSEEVDFSKISISKTVHEIRSSTFDAYSSLAFNFINAYISNAPDFVLDNTTSQISTFVNKLKTSLNGVKSILNKPSITVNSAIDLSNDIKSLFDDISNIFEPALLFVPSVDIKSSVTLPASNAINGLTLSVLDQQQAIETSDLNTQAMRISNQNAVNLLTRGNTLITAVKLLEYAQFESKKEAIAVKINLGSELVSLRKDFGDYGWRESWNSVAVVISALNRDINDKIGRLPQTMRVKPSRVRSSLAVSHRLYADDLSSVLNKSNDLSSRNLAIHPSFLPTDLEVLINE